MKSFYQITNKSLKELGVGTTKELWDKVKGEYKGLSTSVHTEFKQKAENENKFSVIMSTAGEDRHGDIVLQNWELKQFKQNPVLLDSHNYSSIEHIIGRVNKPKVKDGKLVGEIEFMLDNPKGLLGYKMAQQGYLNATSVGFIPLSFNDKGNIENSELLELSAVSVPANAEALFEKAMQTKELEIDEDQIEDNAVVVADLDSQPDEEDEEEVDVCADCECEECECEEDVEEDVEEETETDDAVEEKEIKPSLVRRTVESMKTDEKERAIRRRKLAKQVTNLLEDVASGRSSNKTKINKAVKKLLEVKKISNL